MSARHLALLREINVGGKSRLPMGDLVALFVEAECDDVGTYIQSGHAIFSAAPNISVRVPDVIAARIAERFGYRTPVVVRTVGQLAHVVANNRFLEAGETEDTLHDLFLADPPSRWRIDDLDPDRSPPDAFFVRGQEVYLRLPRGAAHTKLTNDYFDTKLATSSTGG